MQDLDGIYFSSNPTDKTFGKNIVSAKISKDANVLTLQEFIDYDPESYKYWTQEKLLTTDEWVKTKTDIDVITKQSRDGDYDEIIVMNPKVIIKPDIDYTEIWKGVHL